LSRVLGLEDPPTRPIRKLVTEELLSEIAGITTPALRELVRKLRGLDEAAQADLLLEAVEKKTEAGDIEGARRLMRAFACLFPKYAQGDQR
jgi:hypothetical protein